MAEDEDHRDEDNARLELPTLRLPSLRRRRKASPGDQDGPAPTTTQNAAPTAATTVNPPANPTANPPATASPTATPTATAAATSPVETPAPEATPEPRHEPATQTEPTTPPEPVPAPTPAPTPARDPGPRPDPPPTAPMAPMAPTTPTPAGTSPVETPGPDADDDAGPDADDDGTGRRTLALPALTARAAALVTGLAVGVAGAVLTFLALQGCAGIRGTETCGRVVGFPVLVVVLLLMVLLGEVLLAAWTVSEPRSVSVLGVGILAVVVLLFSMGQSLSAWMFLLVPVLTAPCYLLAHWLSTALVEPPPDRGPGVDVR